MKILIEPMTPDDAAGVLKIVRAHNLPWTGWPPGAFGAVARGDGRVLAFCALRETPYGMSIDELYEEKSRIGIAALGRLAVWIEGTTQGLANSRNTPLALGGIVKDDNTVHKDALEKRGYRQVATVLSKGFFPLSQEQAS